MLHFSSRYLQHLHCSNIVGLTALRLAFLWDMNNKNWYNGFYTEFRQSFAKETLSYDEYLKS